MLNYLWRKEPAIEDMNSFYKITGLNFKYANIDFKKMFGTTVIANNILKKVNNYEFKIHKFFMVEFAWLLEHIVEQTSLAQRRRLGNPYQNYKKIYELVKTNTWISSTYKEFPKGDWKSINYKFTKTPRETQAEFLEDYNRIKNGFRLKGCLLDAAAGSGKTITSEIWSEMIKADKKIVICLKNLVENPWVRYINADYKEPPVIWTSLMNTSPIQNKDSEYFIFYKENMRKGDFDAFIETISENGRNSICVIVDECQHYNDYKSQQSEGLVHLCNNKRISNCLFMSGTPIKAMGKETYTLFAAVDPFFDDNVRADFLKMYGRDNTHLNEMLAHRLGRIKFSIPSLDGMGPPPEPKYKKISFPGVEKYTLENVKLDMMAYIKDRALYYTNVMPTYLEDFNNYLDYYASCIEEDKDDLKELESYKRIVERFRKVGYNNFTDAELSKFCKAVEVKIESYLKGDDLHHFRNIKSAIKYVGLKIAGEALGNVLGAARINAVKELIAHAELPSYITSVAKKTAIYTSYVPALKEAKEYLDEQGFNSLVLYGENSKDVDKVVDQFTDDKSVDLLITTFNTLKEGKPLLAANQLLILNAPFRHYELTQTIARIWRIGQDTECFVFIFDLDTGNKVNVMSRNIDIMEWSKEMVEQLMGGGNLSVTSKSINGVNSTFTGFKTFDELNDFITDNATTMFKELKSSIKTKLKTLGDFF